MIANSQINTIENIKPKPENFIKKNFQKYEKEQKEIKHINLIEKKQENHENISPKPNNETNSKFSSNPKPIKEIFSNLELLKDHLKIESSKFLEKFELLEIIKSGSAGSVIKSRPKIKENKSQVNKLIALKFLNNGKDKGNRQNHAEIIIHGSLKNSHIPQIYGYYKVGNNSAIAMELSQYGDLDNFKKKVIKRAPLSETLICYILGGICQAVYYIHTFNKIIHMDIKQQNILVDDYINIKLTDFSVSICYKNMKKIKLPMVGTCYYISPEVLRKETINDYDASKIDVYSIGVLLYLLAFCDYPYKLREVDNKDYGKILENVEKNELTFPKEIEYSKMFLNLIKNCLNKDLNKRYSIYQLMKDPFFEGYQIIMNEKEKLYNAGKFVVDLMVDNIINFNLFIKERENFL